MKSGLLLTLVALTASVSSASAPDCSVYKAMLKCDATYYVANQTDVTPGSKVASITAPYKLRITGDSPEENVCAAVAYHNDKQNGVEFHGYVDASQDLLMVISYNGVSAPFRMHLDGSETQSGLIQINKGIPVKGSSMRIYQAALSCQLL